MTPTKKARRSDALYFDTKVTNRRALCDIIANLESDMEELKAENAKLRELVAVGLRCCDFKCDGCRFNKHNACYVGEFEDEARKLGVEVD